MVLGYPADKFRDRHASEREYGFEINRDVLGFYDDTQGEVACGQLIDQERSQIDDVLMESVQVNQENDIHFHDSLMDVGAVSPQTISIDNDMTPASQESPEPDQIPVREKVFDTQEAPINLASMIGGVMSQVSRDVSVKVNEPSVLSPDMALLPERIDPISHD